MGDVIFYEDYLSIKAKINIAIGGYIGSGKSTLINTIFGEKRCLEGQGGSQTIYISKMALKDYPINFIDFPGFGGKKEGKSNISLFVEEIMNKISDLKKLNEVVHCFLFCIKFEERTFDENDEEMKEVFDAIIDLKIRTFFIITGSEKEESREFRNFKRILVNNLNKIKKNYSKEIADKIFGTDVNKSIIPILSKDKIYHGNMVNAFGLDNLFKKLYEYFLDKKINFEKEIFFNDKKLKEFIKNNELLQIFESKKKLMDDFKNKIQIEFESIIMKIFLKGPKYIYNFSDEAIYEIFNEIMEHLFFLLNYFLSQRTNEEKYKILNCFPYEKFKIELIESSKNYENEIKNSVPSVPWYLKVLFPFISPFYYIIGTPIVKIFSGKITNYILKEMKIDIDDKIYQFFFEEIVLGLNNGIDGLNEISKKFKNYYFSKKIENKLYEILFVEKNSNIDSYNFNIFLDDLLKTNTKEEILNFVNNYLKENEDFLSNVDRNKKDMILNLIKNKNIIK